MGLVLSPIEQSVKREIELLWHRWGIGV